MAFSWPIKTDFQVSIGMARPALYHLPLESDAVDVQEVLPLAGGLLHGREHPDPPCAQPRIL